MYDFKYILTSFSISQLDIDLVEITRSLSSIYRSQVYIDHINPIIGVSSDLLTRQGPHMSSKLQLGNRQPVQGRSSGDTKAIAGSMALPLPNL